MGVSHVVSESSRPVLTSLADAAQNRAEQILLSLKLQICEQSDCCYLTPLRFGMVIQY